MKMQTRMVVIREARCSNLRLEIRCSVFYCLLESIGSVPEIGHDHFLLVRYGSII